jgi:RNA polymerase sigma factor (sigma-70 family)
VSAGNHALMTCIDRFDASKGARFTTYLRYFIRAKVSELWRERDPVNYKKHFPTDSETDMSFREPLEDNTETPDYGGDEFREKMLEALATVRKDLESDEQFLLKQVYEEKKSFAEIARAQGVSREAVRTQHLRLLRRLKSFLKPVRKSLE